jgi:hypothetical protein
MTTNPPNIPDLRAKYANQANWSVRYMTDTELERHIEHCKRLLCRRELDTFARKARQAMARHGRGA